jgi:hypothetical protein
MITFFQFLVALLIDNATTTPVVFNYKEIQTSTYNSSAKADVELTDITWKCYQDSIVMDKSKPFTIKGKWINNSQFETRNSTITISWSIIVWNIHAADGEYFVVYYK